MHLAQLTGDENTPTASLQRGKIFAPTSVLNMRQYDGEVPIMLELLVNTEHSFITLAWSGNP